MNLQTKFFIILVVLVVTPSLVVISLTKDRFASMVEQTTQNQVGLFAEQVSWSLHTSETKATEIAKIVSEQVFSASTGIDRDSLLPQLQDQFPTLQDLQIQLEYAPGSEPSSDELTLRQTKGQPINQDFLQQDGQLIMVTSYLLPLESPDKLYQLRIDTRLSNLENLIKTTRRNSRIMLMLQNANQDILVSDQSLRLALEKALSASDLKPLTKQPSAQLFAWNRTQFQLNSVVLSDRVRLLVVSPNLNQTIFSEALNSQLSSVLFASLLLCLLILHSAITTLVTQPLKQFQALVRNIMDGNLNQRLELQRDDEVGQFSQSLEGLRKHLQRTSNQIEELAYFDTLTGLPNKVNFIDTIQKLIERSNQTRHHVAILFFDLDNFKHVNDGLGHELGDTLLMQVGARLKESIRSHDVLTKTAREWADEDDAMIARLGGDEFTMVLSKISSEQEAARVAERILLKLTQPFQLKDSEIFISASIGISLYPQDGDTPEILLKNADLAMYAAKSHGKNNFHFYDPKMNTPMLERIELESSMRTALENHEFLLYFQPKIPLQGEPHYEYETLMRWIHPSRGMISPGLFIPMAEDCGYIQTLGDWAIEQSCEQIERWNQQGIKPVSVSVNLSPVQLNYGNPLQTIKRCLSLYEIEPQQLEIEITESGLMQNETHAINLLTEIKALGVRIALDDFGTGYSSLAYLLRFPIDTLKIDRAFIKDIEHNEESLIVLETIISLAKRLNLVVVAEGVETKEQFKLLKDRDCDYIQGFYFSKPVIADEAMDYVMNYFASAAAPLKSYSMPFLPN